MPHGAVCRDEQFSVQIQRASIGKAGQEERHLVRDSAGVSGPVDTLLHMGREQPPAAPGLPAKVRPSRALLQIPSFPLHDRVDQRALEHVGPS